jgi:hypothetical protein
MSVSANPKAREGRADGPDAEEKMIFRGRRIVFSEGAQRWTTALG